MSCGIRKVSSIIHHDCRCGIDTILAETRSCLIDYAKKDRKRYILTCGKAADEVDFQWVGH